MGALRLARSGRRSTCPLTARASVHLTTKAPSARPSPFLLRVLVHALDAQYRNWSTLPTSHDLQWALCFWLGARKCSIILSALDDRLSPASCRFVLLCFVVDGLSPVSHCCSSFARTSLRTELAAHLIINALSARPSPFLLRVLVRAPDAQYRNWCTLPTSHDLQWALCSGWALASAQSFYRLRMAGFRLPPLRLLCFVVDGLSPVSHLFLSLFVCTLRRAGLATHCVVCVRARRVLCGLCQGGPLPESSFRFAVGVVGWPPAASDSSSRCAFLCGRSRSRLLCGGVGV